MFFSNKKKILWFRTESGDLNPTLKSSKILLKKTKENEIYNIIKRKCFKILNFSLSTYYV